MPNPAPCLASIRWLNEALMARWNCGFLAIIDAARLQHIVEWQPIGDALCADAKRARRQHVDLAMAKPGAPTAIVDSRSRTVVLDHRCGASPRPMLESGEYHHVGETLADRQSYPRRAADLPQPRLRLRKRRWPSSGNEDWHGRNGCRDTRQTESAVHKKPPLTSPPLTVGSPCADRPIRSTPSARW